MDFIAKDLPAMMASAVANGTKFVCSSALHSVSDKSTTVAHSMTTPKGKTLMLIGGLQIVVWWYANRTATPMLLVTENGEVRGTEECDAPSVALSAKLARLPRFLYHRGLRWVKRKALILPACVCTIFTAWWGSDILLDYNMTAIRPPPSDPQNNGNGHPIAEFILSTLFGSNVKIDE